MTRRATARGAALAALLFGLGCAASSDPSADVAAARADAALRAGFPEDAALTADDAATRAAARALLSEPLDAERAVRVALALNPAVRASYERLGVARADVVRAGLLRNPTLDVQALFFDEGTELDLHLMAPLFELFSGPLRRAKADAALAAASATVRRDLVALAFDVRRALVRAVAAEELLALARRDAATAADAADLLRKLRDAGNLVPHELTAGEIAAADARLALAAAETDALTAREPVNALLGLFGPDAAAWRPAPAALPVSATEPPRGSLETVAVASSFDLARIAAELDAAAQEAGADARDAVFGDFGVGIGAMRETDGAWGAGPTAALPLPVFDTGATADARGAARLRMLAAARSALGVEIRSAARTLRLRAEHAAARARFFAATSLPLAHRFTLETLQQYNAMQIGTFDVLAARRREFAVERAAVAARRDAETARLDLSELLAGALRRDRATAMPASDAADPTDHDAPPGVKKGH